MNPIDAFKEIFSPAKKIEKFTREVTAETPWLYDQVSEMIRTDRYLDRLARKNEVKKFKEIIRKCKAAGIPLKRYPEVHDRRN